MKFVSAVQKRKFAWPTHQSFSYEDWTKQADKLCEDDRDRALLQSGQWVADTLTPIRKTVETFSIWEYPWDVRAQYFVALCNRDYALVQIHAQTFMQSSNTRLISLNEDILESIDQNFYGSDKITDLLEGHIDALNLCLGYQPPQSILTTSPDVLIDLVWAIRLGVIYQTTEEFFYRALWQDWRVKKEGNHWKLFPNDQKTLKLWEASWRRFEHLRHEESIKVFDKWNNDASIRHKWIQRNTGKPKFIIQKRGGLLRVKFTGSLNQPSTSDFVNEKILSEFYYSVFFKEPLPALNGHCVDDLLNILKMLGAISDKLMETFPKTLEIKTIEQLTDYSPIISKRFLVKALSQASDLPKKSISKILDALTWSRNRSIWFHPLIPLKTKDGFLLATLTTSAPNLYRFIDYWLSNLGLTVERRGYLFEQQIEQVLGEVVNQCEMTDIVKIAGSHKIKSSDKLSVEEIDSIILLNDLLVVGEAKCQSLPITPVDERNYLQVLSDGASQAKRKAEWVKSNLMEVAQILEIDVAMLSGKVEPIVITNHSVGVGLSFQGVPVLDLVLLRNYFARPYFSDAKFTSTGLQVTQKSPYYYSSKRELADKFYIYATKPFFLEIYQNHLQAEWKEYPLRDEKVFMLQYVLNREQLPNNSHWT